MDADLYLPDQQSPDQAETFASLRQTRLGIVPENRELDEARRAGDRSRIIKAVICQAVALAHCGRPYRARTELARLSDDDVENLDLPWGWAVANARGVVAEDFCQYETARTEHRLSLNIATEVGDLGLLSVSRIQLARLAVESGMMHEALTHLGQMSREGPVPMEVSAAHSLLVSITTSRLSTAGAAFTSAGSASAANTAPSLPIEAPTRLLLGVCLLAVERGELHWVKELLDHSRAKRNSSGSDYQAAELILLHATVEHLSGDRTWPLQQLDNILSGCPTDVALYSRALVTKASILYDNERYEEALVALNNHDPSNSLQAVSCVELERSIHLKLENWQEAANAFGKLRSLTRPSPIEVATLYRLQAAATEAGALRARNILLRKRNEQIAEGLIERDTILNTISNRLQSPLTALSLSSELLARESSPEQRTARLKTAIQTIARIEEMSRQILLSQELGEPELLLFPEDITLSALGSRLTLDQTSTSTGRSILITVTAPRDPIINIDVERLGQLISSLLWGVSEFSNDEAPVEIRVKDHRDFGAIIQVVVPALRIETLPMLPTGRAEQLRDVRDKRDVGAELTFRAAYQLAARLHVEVSIENGPANDATFTIGIPRNTNAS